MPNLEDTEKSTSKKTGMPIIPVCFFVIIFLCLTFMLRIIKSNSYHFYVKGFGYPLENIKLTFEAKERYHQQAFLVCYDDYCKTPSTNEFRSYYSSEFTSEEVEFHEKKVNKMYLVADKELKDFPKDLTNIDINVGNKNIYLNEEDISKLETKEFSINLKTENGKKEIKKYNALILPEVNNYRGKLSHISNIVLSLFYNWKFFIVPYFWLIVAGIMFILNRDEFKFKLSFNKKMFYFVLGGIVLLGAYLRLVDITYFPLWTDEIYTRHIALKDFISCFKDAGNPPLFFVLEYIFTKIFSNSLFALRFLPFVFGMLFIFYTFLLFKDTVKKDDKLPLFALFATFMASVNTVNIYHSQEARGYSLCMFLAVASIYYLFKYLKNPTNKGLTVFSIFNIFLVNTNYYLILLSITNYIWGVVDLAQNKEISSKKKEIIKYTLSYVVTVLTTVPYFVISSKTAFSGGFNGWIPPLDHETFLYTVNEFFINKYVFLALCVVVLVNLILTYLPKNLLEKINIKVDTKKENLFLYLVYTLALIIILASLISIFIKPIFHKRVLLSIYSLLFLTEIVTISSVVEFIKENKAIKVLKSLYTTILLLTYFMITSPMPVRSLFCINDYMEFIKNDIKQYGADYEIHAIVTDTKEYLKEYPEIYGNKRIKFHFLDTNSGSVLTSIKRDDYIKQGKKGVVYFNGIGVDVEKISSFNPVIRIYGNNSAVSGKLVY